MISNTELIKIERVNIVNGSLLKNHWENEMQQIYIVGKKGFYIDVLNNNRKRYWQNYVGVNITNVFTRESSGFTWLDSKKVIIQNTKYESVENKIWKYLKSKIWNSNL